MSYSLRGKPTKGFYREIFISKKSHDKRVHVAHHNYWCQKEGYQVVHTKDRDFPDDPKFMILAPFGKKMTHHIMAYWGEEIRGLDETIGWYWYVKLYNFFHRKKTEG